MAKSASEAGRLEGNPWTPYIYIAPIALYLLLFQGYPLVQELLLSFTSTSLLSPQDNVPVGLDNYRELLSTSDFHNTILITAIYTIACVVLSIGLGLAAALLLDRPFQGRGVARAAVTIPWAAPSVAVALIFTWIFNAQYGVFNYAQRAVGLPTGHENWLDSPSLALPAILLTTVWQIFPFASVVLLAALQGVSSELREAAVIDGADRLSVVQGRRLADDPADGCPPRALHHDLVAAALRPHLADDPGRPDRRHEYPRHRALSTGFRLSRARSRRRRWHDRPDDRPRRDARSTSRLTQQAERAKGQR